jgi:hypothetical protein
MKTWIKPAVGWGIVDSNHSLWLETHAIKTDAEIQAWMGEKTIPVALVPLAVARRAGLLRRPK